MSLSLDDLTPVQKSLIDDELVPGEPILWMAHRDRRKNFLGFAAATLFGLFILTVSAILCWIAVDGGISNPIARVLMPLGFGAFGILILKAAASSYRQQKTTVYVLTDRRVIVLWEERDMSSVQSIDQSQFTAVRRLQRSDGSGDVILERAGYPVVAINNIPDLKHVYGMLQKLATGKTEGDA